MILLGLFKNNNTFLDAISCSKLSGGHTGQVILGAQGHEGATGADKVSTFTKILHGWHLTCAAHGQNCDLEAKNKFYLYYIQ